MSRINRARRIALLSPLAFALAFGAYAQESPTGSTMGSVQATADAAPSTPAYLAANAKMHADMAVPLTGDADVDFVRSMIPHHEGAVEMAKIVSEYGDDPEVRKLAEEIIAAQEAEIAWMVEWLEKNGQP
ncbi:DUF305 domain-containing protein [Sinirhodobacter sp. HNIBRBA609]|nr:DUF305 domain-containing protein [Sinirhodobacter sp. HNIBRBA609]